MISIFPLFLSAPCTAGCRIQYLQTVVKLDQHCQCHCCKKPVPRHALGRPSIPFLCLPMLKNFLQSMLSNRVARCIQYQGNMIQTMCFQRFFHPALRFLLHILTAVVAVAGTMTSAKLLHPITLPEGQPHVLESRGYDEAPTWLFLLEGLSKTMDHRVLIPTTNEPLDLMGKQHMASGRPIGDGKLHEQLLFC